MKRTIIAVISIVLIAFAFTACRQSVVIPFDPVPGNPNTPVTPTPDPSIDDTVDSYEDLLAALTDPDILTIKLSAGFSMTPAEAAALPFTREGITFDGNNMTLTISSDNPVTTPSTPAPVKSDIFTINAPGITFRNLNLVVTDASISTWMVVVNNNKFTFEGGSITGEIYFDQDYSTVNMGIVINAGTTGTVIKNVELKGNYTPVTASSPAFELNNVKFESGMEIDSISEATKITECSELSDAEYIAAFTIVSGCDAAKAKEISKANNNCVVTASDGVKYNQDGVVIRKLDDLKTFAEKAEEGAVAYMMIAEDEVIEVAETINFNKAVTLHGNGATIKITQTDNKNGAAFSVNANNVKLDGLNFVGGDTPMAATSAPDAIIVGTGMTGFEITDSTFFGVFEKDGSDYKATMRMGIALQPGVKATIEDVVMQYVYTPIQAYGSFTMKGVQFNSGINMNSAASSDYSQLVIENCSSKKGTSEVYDKGGKIVFNLENITDSTTAKATVEKLVLEKWKPENSSIAFYFGSNTSGNGTETEITAD